MREINDALEVLIHSRTETNQNAETIKMVALLGCGSQHKTHCAGLGLKGQLTCRLFRE